MEDRIDQYLSGELDAESRRAFEARCDADPAFAEVVRQHIRAEYVARQLARKQRFDALVQEYDRHKGEGAPVRLLRPQWVIAAATLILLLLGLLWVLRNEVAPSDPQALYASHLEAYPLSARRDAAGSSWQAFSEAYGRQDYATAARLAEALLADSADSRLQLYLGVSQLMSDQPEDAIRSLAQVDSASSFIEPAGWYTALAYLRLDDVVAAKEILEKIATTPHYRRKEARQLLERMR